MNRRLITSALPYVNNVPHLGNLIQMLSADVFARFCRSRGYDTLYICGTDEYGTATETKALEEHKCPRELCDYYYKLHTEIYDWFDIAFDKFGRTSNDEIKEITQGIFKDLDRNGYIHEHTTKQLYCPHCKMFLADRYVRGTCPKCGYEDARGDQCDKCGSLLDPVDLKNPRCNTCGATPEIRETKHLYIDLPSIAPKLNEWMEKTSVEGKWSANAIQMTKAWIRDGLNERAITRDLKWGIPVPKEGYEDKVFYVWFDAPIGYISITKQLADELTAAGKTSFDYKSWWLPSESQEAKGKAEVDLFQFIGKDNIPFHTVIFPSSLIGSGRNWTKLYHMSSTEFLNYEDGKFSKSRGIGVFGTDAKESGILADAWRFYIFYNRPEKSDYQFTWKDFQEKYNSELIGNLGNLVNRTVLFVSKYYDGKIPAASVDEELWTQIRGHEQKITNLLEWAELRDAFHELFIISDIANKAFQSAEPWKTRTTEPEKAAKLIYNLCYVIKDLMIMVQPYLPQYAQKVMSFFGKAILDSRTGYSSIPGALTWNDLGNMSGLCDIGVTEVYFKPMDQKTMLAFREKFSGNQKNRTENGNKTGQQDKKAEKKNEKNSLAADMPAHFNRYIALKVAKIIQVERNPESDKLYIEHLDDGSGNERVIQSGLVPYLKPEDLLGRHIILADNLAPRKMRGVESRGMLLASDYTDENGKACVEPLTAPWAAPGTPVVLEGTDPTAQKEKEISADVFFQIEIKVNNKLVMIADKKLVVDGKFLTTTYSVNGGVN
ncbi:MAG: methionine--tRNA ligase [Treponema sp.]|nr:methionine--tRNA ligase [Treponema sp.]